MYPDIRSLWVMKTNMEMKWKPRSGQRGLKGLVELYEECFLVVEPSKILFRS